MAEQIEIYTDGACKGNPGPGGWGVLLRYRGKEKTLAGAEWDTTNNRMELMAAIQGLKALTRPCKVAIYTDSQYVRNGITNWIQNWQKKNWRGADNKPIKNIDLWQELLKAEDPHQVEWHWVKGHSNHPENDIADALARGAIENLLASHDAKDH